MPQLEIQILKKSTKAVSLHICCNSHSSDSEYLIWCGVVAYAPFCRWEPLQIASGHRPGGRNWDSGNSSPLALAGILILSRPRELMEAVGGRLHPLALDSVVPTWFEHVPLGLGYCETTRAFLHHQYEMVKSGSFFLGLLATSKSFVATTSLQMINLKIKDSYKLSYWFWKNNKKCNTPLIFFSSIFR